MWKIVLFILAYVFGIAPINLAHAIKCEHEFHMQISEKNVADFLEENAALIKLSLLMIDSSLNVNIESCSDTDDSCVSYSIKGRELECFSTSKCEKMNVNATIHVQTEKIPGIDSLFIFSGCVTTRSEESVLFSFGLLFFIRTILLEREAHFCSKIRTN